MAKLLCLDGQILKINTTKLTPASLLKSLEGDYNAHELLSGDLLIYNQNGQSPEAYPENKAAYSISGKVFYGPVILCEPQELD